MKLFLQASVDILIIFFVSAILFSQEAMTQNFSVDNFYFEQQWLLKNIGDQLFIQGGDQKLKEAKSYYEKAYSIKDFYSAEAVAKSQYYFQDPRKIKLLIDFVNLDIEYRKKLIDNNIDFWGLTYHEKVLKPKNHYISFMTYFETFEKLAQKLSDLERRETEDNISILLNDIKQLSTTINKDIIKVDLQKFEREQAFYDDQISKFTSKRNDKVSESEALAIDAKKDLDQIDQLENEMVENVKNAAFSYFGSTEIINANANDLGFDIINKIDDPQLVGSIMETTSSVQEWIKFGQEIHEQYKKVKKVVDVAKEVDNLIDNGDFKITSILAIGAKVSEGLSNFELTSDLSQELQEKMNWLNKANNLVEVIGKNVDLDDCLKSKDAKVECIVSRIRSIETAANEIDPQSYDWLLRNVNELFPDTEAPINLTKYIDQLDLENYLKIITDIQDKITIEDLKEIEKANYQINEVLKESTLDSYYKVGDIIFDTKLLEAHRKEWKNFIEESKPLRLLVKYLEGQNSENFKELYYSILENIDHEYIDDFILINGKMLLGQYKKESIVLDQKIESFVLNNFYDEFYGILPKKKLFRNKIQQESFLSLYNEGRIQIYEETISAPKKIGKDNIISYELSRPYSKFIESIPTFQTYKPQVVKAFILSNRQNLNLDYKLILSDFLKMVCESDVKKLGIDSNYENLKSFTDRTFELVYEKLSSKSKNQFKEYGAKNIIGIQATMSKDNYKKSNDTFFKKSMQQLPYSVSATNLDNIEKDNVIAKQAIVSALNYYIPGLGQAVLAVDNYFAVNNKIKQYENKYKKMRENAKEIFQYTTQIDDREMKKDLLSFEKSKAELSVKLSELQLEIFDKIEEKYKELNTITRAEIANTLPKYYYLSEKLRQEYLLLNKALKFWKGQSFQDLLMNDPNNLRFGIDPDVRLYEWFNLVHLGKRTNPSGIYSELKGIENLLLTNKSIIELQNVKSEIVQKEITSNFSLVNPDKDMNYSLSFEEEDFRRTQNGSSQFRKRIIQVGAIGFDKENKEVELANISLSHSGIFYFRTKEEGKYEVTLQKQSDLALSAFRNQDFYFLDIPDRKKWLEKLNDPELDIGTGFFGYGPESRWDITIGKKANPNLNRLKLQIFYIYESSEEEGERFNEVLTLSKDHPLYFDHSKFSLVIDNRILKSESAPLITSKNPKAINEYPSKYNLRTINSSNPIILPIESN